MSPKTPQLYECRNTTSCPLGTSGARGMFTGGRTAEQATLVTGTPAEHLTEGDDYGDGICPNCGHKGTPVKASDE